MTLIVDAPKAYALHAEGVGIHRQTMNAESLVILTRTHWLAGGVALWLCACGQAGMTGTYEDEMGLTSYEFQRDGAVYMNVLGTKVAAEYRLDGDKVLVTSPQGTLVLTRNAERLYGPMGLELVKRE